MKKYLFILFYLLCYSCNPIFAQDTDTIPTGKIPPMATPQMTYEELIAVFEPLKNTPETATIKQMQEQEKKLRELRDKSNYLVRYMADPIKKKAAENKKIEKEAINQQKKLNEANEAKNEEQREKAAAQEEATRQKQAALQALKESKRKKDKALFDRMSADTVPQQTEENEQIDSGDAIADSTKAAWGKLEVAEKELEKMKKELAPVEKLSNLIRTEWAKLDTRLQTQTDKAGADASKSFETLTLEQIYDPATKEVKMEVIDYYKENLFYSKKPYTINCKSGVGTNLLKDIDLIGGNNKKQVDPNLSKEEKAAQKKAEEEEKKKNDKENIKQKQQGCIGYVSSLNKNNFYNLIIIKLTDGTVKAVLWGKNNETKPTEPDYKSGAMKVW
jgi:hypothetical protein